MKILFITPHLSTGGGPQYLLKKIMELNSDHDVYCVEYADITGGVLVVQRTQMQSLLKEKLITLYEDKFELIKHIQNINPDVIHFEELPEYFCDKLLAHQVYNPNRTYKIIETSHDSSFNPNNKCFFPDGFALISEYQRRIFACLNIPMSIVEYPIVYRKKSNRESALKELNLDPRKTHFLNVGLFTSRKNQSEIIEYAKHLLNENIQFHFVGNQAENFKYYWEPLMKQFPSNCKWWGERKDVDTFYNAMDVFLFSSKGTTHDKETSPLVIREAIGWDLPILMYNLPVYCGMYDSYPNLNWLTHNFESNLKLIKDRIKNYNHNSNSHRDLAMNVSFQEPNIINISTPIGFNGIISVRDNLTKIPLFYCHVDMQKNCDWNIQPNRDRNFKNETYFSEFLLEFYDNNKQFIDSRILKVRELDYIPVSVNKNFSPFDCLYINYKQMFYEDIYSHCYLDDLETVIDLGANVGLFSLYMLKKHKCKRIYAVEPTKKAFSQLSDSLRDETNASVHKLAIHNFDGKSKIKSVEDNSTISGFIDGVHPYTHHNMKEEEVDVVTLNRFMNDHNLDHVDLIKIDIEGSEYDVIDSLSDYDILKSDRYLIEYHWSKTKNIKKIVDRFKFLGYNILNNEDPTFDNDLGFFFAYKNITRLEKELFDISFNDENNKLDIIYNGKDTSIDSLFTVKDRDSKACIYSYGWESLNCNASFWMVPLPKHVYDFKNDVNFSGFLLEVFAKNKTEKIYKKEIILKNIEIKKSVLEFSDEDPIFLNYNEFFVDKIYDELNLKNLNICFDIGSNVGLFTKYLKLNNCNKIFCFEPNKMAFNSLQKNLKDENDVELFNLAVSHNNDALRLYIDDNNSLISSAHDIKNNYYDVETITLKDIFERNKIQKVDFVKIDIEGMEFDLIENLDDSVFQKIDKFLIEYHDFYFTDGSQKLEKLKNKLNLMGYEIVIKHKFIYATKSHQ